MRGKYIFFEAFPVGITNPALSWRDNNNLFKFDVTFAYTNWIIDNQPSLANPLELETARAGIRELAAETQTP
jgi:hypothetical protein